MLALYPNAEDSASMKLKTMLANSIQHRYIHDMNRLSTQKRAQILQLMSEGVSIRAITRLMGVSKNTVAKLLVEAGKACSDYQHRELRKLPCKRVQVDEIWSFVYAKSKNLPPDLRGKKGVGSVWTWTAIDPDSKLMVSWYLGGRDLDSAHTFMNDLAERLANRVQLTSDGHHAYLEAVEGSFGRAVDYAQLVKLYGDESKPDKDKPSERYVGADRTPFIGQPDPKHISTSICERMNLTMRMNIRRFSRRTNAFSKKVENHNHALAIYFMVYNFVRVHQTLRVTPAMEAGVAKTVWSYEDVVRVIDAESSK